MRVAFFSFVLLFLYLSLGLAPARAATPASEAFTTAKQLLDTGNDQQAIDAFNKFLTDYPNDVNALVANYDLGCAYANLTQYPRALAAFAGVLEKATAADQQKVRAQAYFQTADCQAQLKAYAKAVDAYRACLHLLTKDDADLRAQAEYWLGDALTQLDGHQQEALDAYAQVITIDPQHALAPWSLYAQGNIKLRQREYLSALDLFKKVLTDFPADEAVAATKLAMGMTYVQLGQHAKNEAERTRNYQQAEPLLAEVQNDEKTDQAVRRQAARALAQVYGEEQRVDLADAAYARALLGLDTHDPAAQAIHLDRANVLFNADRFADAAVEYETVVHGQDAAAGLNALYWLGNCRYQQATKSHDRADYARAIAAFQLYLAGAKTDDIHGAHAQLLLAYCQEDVAGLGDDAARRAAIDSYTQLATRWPQSREAAETPNGLLRLTTGMAPAALAQILPTLPDGPASWGISLQLARQSYLNNQEQQVVETMQKLLKKPLTDDLLAQAAYLLGAAELRLDGHAPDAIPAFIQALAKAGTGTSAGDLRARATQGLVQAYLATQQFPAAIESARKLMKLPSSIGDAAARELEMATRWELLGRAYAGAKQYAQVIDAYQHLIDACPHVPMLPHALFACGWAAEGMPDPARAETYYRKLITDFPTADETSDATLHLAELLADGKRYQDVIDLLAIFPAKAALTQQAAAAYDVALAYAGLGKDDEANSRFSALADKFPASPVAGDCLVRVGEYQRLKQHYTAAKAAFTRALALLPADSTLPARLYYNIGACDLHDHAYAEAIKDFDMVLTQYPTASSAADCLYWKAQGLEMQGKDTLLNARTAYQQYLASYPTGPCALDAALGAGRTALLLALYDAARDDLTKAIDQSKRADLPANLTERAKNVLPEAYFDLGKCQSAQGHYSDALATYAHIAACNLEPWYSRSLLEMARCSAESGDKVAAQRTLQLLLKQFPQSEAAVQAPKLADELHLEMK